LDEYVKAIAALTWPCTIHIEPNINYPTTKDGWVCSKQLNDWVVDSTLPLKSSSPSSLINKVNVLSVNNPKILKSRNFFWDSIGYPLRTNVTGLFCVEK